MILWVKCSCSDLRYKVVPEMVDAWQLDPDQEVGQMMEIPVRPRVLCPECLLEMSVVHK